MHEEEKEEEGKRTKKKIERHNISMNEIERQIEENSRETRISHLKFPFHLCVCIVVFFTVGFRVVVFFLRCVALKKRVEITEIIGIILEASHNPCAHRTLRYLSW